MMVSAILSGVTAWIGGPFAGKPSEGERCEQCGRRDALKLFRVEVSFGGKKITRKARLCRECMKRARAEISCLPETKWIH
ncbi:hypothetical protein [Desulfovibrio sp. JC010]|uniref:hypothetical protein n=1 Tax=Desulfovibrio sp. JC010 TaxID=2593641 RepID=UPI0013D0D5EE|nr:hypothetical protein [Desulfovibrio sp. JC010]NDV28029.1 hypothetical protein [Desulfovibrio sp. JC010]